MHVDLQPGYYKIINEEWKNFAGVYASDSNTSPIVRAGTQVEGILAADDAPVTWYIQPLRNEHYFLLSATAPQLYAVAGGSGPKINIEMRPDNDHQQWAIEDTDTRDVYYIRKSDNRHVWSLENNKLNTPVVLAEQRNANRSQWRFELTTRPSSVGVSPLYSPSGIVQPQLGDEKPVVLKGPAARVSGIVAILNGSKQYMRVTSNNGLSFNSMQCDDYSLFAVRNLGGEISLINIKSGKHINLDRISNIVCQGLGGGLTLGVYSRPDGRYNLTISNFQGRTGKTQYLSSQAGNDGNLSLKQLADDRCHFSIEKMAYTGFQGVVVLRNRSNYCMRVNVSQGIIFDTLAPNEDARFIVQTKGRKFCLIGNNGYHLNLHSNRNKVFVRCDGAGEGVEFAVHMNPECVYLAISGQGTNGSETHYISSKKSDSGGFDSLDVVPNANEGCEFRFENISQQ
ncbi:hypothetical protein QCA50_010881 [Cerrena zonata]|uniref:Ricin B lectin domain-containing protein n=1 Tax=Cerrena zonata TaxID=2478898 RepID=A0AAW0G307_9APHY